MQYRVDGGKPEKPERFLDRLAAGLKKLFAGDQIEAMLYLRDEGSGIREATVSFGGAEYRVEPETGRYAVIEGETYEVLPLLLTKEAAESLKIEPDPRPGRECGGGGRSSAAQWKEAGF